MRWHLLIPVVAGTLAGALAILLGSRDVPPTDPELLARRREVARLRAHFWRRRLAFSPRMDLLLAHRMTRQ